MNKESPCMKKGKCTKHYPKSYNDTTCLDGGGYPVYRRRNDGVEVAVRGGRKETNIDVVPYNPHLLRMFNCHINVEVCAGIRAVKYINKYIYKGYDKTTFVVGSTDEIQIYIDARYIGPPEAVWHLFGYHMHREMPHVERLSIHLKGMQRIVYESETSTEGVTQTAENYKSKLMAYFEYNYENPDSPAYTYQEFPQHFVWKKDRWEVRKQRFAIVRKYFVSPNAGELFYLRLLLTVVAGARSFEHLRTVNGVLHPTYKKACVELGLLERDAEFVYCLREAATVQVGSQMRKLFKIILADGNPAEPELLWREFKTHICDDLHHVIKKNSVERRGGSKFFLNGSAGTGKTFVYNTITASCRLKGDIVLTVASSGIASLLLEGGRTAHSTFKIPIEITCTGATLIIWDEVPMQHKYCIEAVNRLLQDIHENKEDDFGGVTVVMGGDFRQTLPVIPNRGSEPVNKVDLPSAVNTEIHTYLAADRLTPDKSGRIPPISNEFLRNLNPPGMPLFKLQIKVRCPIILMRNLAPSDGLCNGTRLLVTHCGKYLIQVKILTGKKSKIREVVMLPRISFQPNISELNKNMLRRQFPIRLASTDTEDAGFPFPMSEEMELLEVWIQDDAIKLPPIRHPPTEKNMADPSTATTIGLSIIRPKTATG
ncbi:uncharacterized protein LOC113360429 [Papaver somniferum]|uniref:uncharacterized protein LOC113360429 n=1 Tax=Papaver somniferum TaxID=3469 RepID=UPI000E6F5029|nr:uncharacterized protein LOC113360429 [Papaver somniferum]